MASGQCVLAALALSLWGASAKTALLVVDVQDCFLPNGTLEVPAAHIVPKIVQMRDEKACLWDEVVYSQDFHLANHISFGSTHGLAPFSHLAGLDFPIMCTNPDSGLTQDSFCCPKAYIDSSVNCSANLCSPAGWSYDINNSDFVTGNEACTTCADTPEDCFETVQAMWTDHCLQTGDSGFPAALGVPENALVVQKGTNKFVDAYSGFMDNTGTTKTQLESFLKDNEIDHVYIVGIATDVCVQWTVRDAVDLGFNVTVVKDATEAVLGDQEAKAAALTFMEEMGAPLVTTADVLAMTCPPTPFLAPTPADVSGSWRGRGVHVMLGMTTLLMWKSFV